jgi:hypothetical protein
VLTNSAIDLYIDSVQSSLHFHTLASYLYILKFLNALDRCVETGLTPKRVERRKSNF